MTHVNLSRRQAEEHLGDLFRKVMPLSEVQRKTILGTMVAAKGNREAAAEWLGISRTTLFRRLTEYNYPECLKP